MTQPSDSRGASAEADAGQDGIIIERTVIDRIRQIPSRLKLLIALGIVLLVLGLTGTLRASNGVEIERDEAITIARNEIDFQPTNADARFIRHGFALQPVWAVSLSIPAEEGGRGDFERLVIVELDGVTGEVLDIIDDDAESDDG